MNRITVSRVDTELYLAVRRVKRRIMFKNPLVDFSKVVFVDVPCYDALNHESMHRVFPQAQNNVGRLLTLDGLHPGGKVTADWDDAQETVRFKLTDAERRGRPDA